MQQWTFLFYFCGALLLLLTKYSKNFKSPRVSSSQIQELSLSLSLSSRSPNEKNGVPTRASPELGGGSEAFFPLLSKVTLAPTQRLAVT